VSYGDDYAACIKEAGDDPDVTNGIEVRASIRLQHGDTETQSIIKGGEGVGRFTLPGFDYPPGEAAINKAPREMIRQNLERLCISESLCSNYIIVTISVPQGTEIARRTFNPRLGLKGASPSLVFRAS
jgi:cobalt-precorrin-5B (C1)-methyltransferase